MIINSSNCKENFIQQLNAIPLKWREQIASMLCLYLNIGQSVDCDDVKACETVTTLSQFTVTGTNVCIKYTDELGIQVNRCFDFADIINQSLDDVDPKCLMSRSQWHGLSYIQKWQSIIDKVCTDCNGTTSSSTTTTSSSTTTTTTHATTTTSSTSTSSTSTTTHSTTTTTTQAPACKVYTLTNYTNRSNRFTYTTCERDATPDGLLLPGQRFEFCALVGSVVAGANTLSEGETCHGSFTTTSTTTTTTIPGEIICRIYTITNNSGSQQLFEFTNCPAGPGGYGTLNDGEDISVCALEGTVVANNMTVIIGPRCGDGFTTSTSTTSTTTEFCPECVGITWQQIV